MQEVDVLTREIVNPLERWQRWRFQSVIADQAAHHGPILLLDVTPVVVEVGPRARVGAPADERFFDVRAGCRCAFGLYKTC
jgi:hypothetical protein